MEFGFKRVDYVTATNKTAYPEKLCGRYSNI